MRISKKMWKSFAYKNLILLLSLISFVDSVSMPTGDKKLEVISTGTERGNVVLQLNPESRPKNGFVLATLETTIDDQSNSSVNNEGYQLQRIRTCSQKDNQGLNECLKEVLEELKPRLAEGMPEVGLPGMDPLRIPYLTFQHGEGSIKISSQFNDVEITGLSKFSKSDFWVDISNKTLDFDVTFPHTLLAGSYQLNGNLFFVPIAGSGHFWLNLGGVTVKGLGKLDLVNVKSPAGRVAQHVVLNGTRLDLNIESIKVHLTNLFNGDRLLGPVINNFLNENSQEIFEELKPQIRDQVGEMLTQLSNKALAALPLEFFDNLPLLSPEKASTNNTATITSTHAPFLIPKS